MKHKQDDPLRGIPPEVLLAPDMFRHVQFAFEETERIADRIAEAVVTPIFAPVIWAAKTISRAVVRWRTKGREMWEFGFYVPKHVGGFQTERTLGPRLTIGCPDDRLWDEARHEVFDVKPKVTLDWLVGWLGPYRAAARLDPVPCAKDRDDVDLWLVSIPTRDGRVDLSCPVTVKLPGDKVEVLTYDEETKLTVSAIIQRIHMRQMMAMYPWYRTILFAGMASIGAMLPLMLPKLRAMLKEGGDAGA